MKHTYVIILLLGAMQLFASCSSSEPNDNITVAVQPRMFSLVNDESRSGSSATTLDDVAYSIVYDDNTKECNLTISNIALGDNPEDPEILYFEKVPWKYPVRQAGKALIIDEPAVTGKNHAGAEVTLTDVLIVYYQTNNMQQYACSGLYARYTVNSRYQVTAFPYGVLAQGTTVSISETTEKKIDYEAIYELNFFPSIGEADLKIVGLQPGEGLSALDVTIKRLGFTLTDDGYSLSMLPSTTVEVDGGASDFALAAFEGEADLRDQLKLRYTVSAADKYFSIEAFLTPNLALSFDYKE